MEVTAVMVKELREKTGVGMMDCKKALNECAGDMDKAIKYLREKGLASAAKRAGRATREGAIDSYIHVGSRIGVLVEVNCETDFVARTDEFRAFARDIAMQIAASRPEYIRREDVPPEVVEREKEILRNQAASEGKPPNIIERMVEGRLEKFYKEFCLIEQPFIKTPEITVLQLLNEKISKLGENISIRRFVRFELGEDLEK